MTEQPFTHLHVHSHYSLLDSTCRIPDLVERAQKYGMSHLALTDHGNLFGAVEFYQTCTDAGIQPIIGMEAYVAPASRHNRTKGRKKGSWPHLVLLAQNETGYRNLVRLSSLAYTEGFYYKPRIDKEILSQYSEGLIGLSACIQGEVNQALLAGQFDQAAEIVHTYQSILGKENFFLEIMDHGIPEQKKIISHVPELSRKTGAPIVATCDVHYLDATDARAHEIHLCIKTGKTIHDEKRMTMATDRLYFRSRQEMHQLFKDIPEAVENTQKIAERIDFSFNFEQECLPEFHYEGVTDNKQFFEQICTEGFQRFFPDQPVEYRKRLKHEMEVIERMGYIDYFLIVWDFIRYARKHDIPVGPGRGSAAGSLVAYCMEITQLNPMKYDLLFERFLNEARISMPDIDIDFCMDKRGQVIEYVINKYGSDRVCQIITFNTMAARSVIRDVGRVLCIPLKEVDAICKKIPEGPKITLAKAFEEEPELKKIAEEKSEYRELFEIAPKLEGLNRNAGTHAAGIVIGDRPLMDIVPLYKTEDMSATQYSMENLERLGLLKMDFLGLRTLTIIDMARRMIKENHGIDLTFDSERLDDPKTYQLLRNGDSIAVFQLESSGMRELLKQLRPDRFEDLIALLALYRPGPLGSGMDKTYVKRKHGLEEIDFPHNWLEEILTETNGVILYQEQVMRITNILAGFSLNEADSLRKAMGKKKLKLMAQYRQQFVDGCMKNDISHEKATYIFDLMEEFAKYGFNKSHSAAYALISYQTAFLKANYPKEFMAAVLSCEMHNTEKVAWFLEECKRMQIPIKAPDINLSQEYFSVKDGNIVYALSAIKNVGIKKVKEAVLKRKKLKNSRFTSIYHFMEEVDAGTVNKTMLENLTKAGAFDSTHDCRASVYSGIEKAIAMGNAKQKDRAIGQLSFEDLLAASGQEPVEEDVTYPETQPWSETQKLAFEKEVLGLYLSGHPLTHHETLIRSLPVCALNMLDEKTPGRPVLLAAQLIDLRVIKTRRGDKMAFVKLEDLSGQGEAVVFPECFTQHEQLLEIDTPFFIKADLTEKEGERSLIAQAFIPMKDAPEQLSSSLSISLDIETTTEDDLFVLKRMFFEHPGSCPVHLIFHKNGRQQKLSVAKSLSVCPDSSLLKELHSLRGLRTIAVNTSQQEGLLAS